ncbi:MAG: hypothetical protein C7B44_13455 [Sulfobacillus thermosulfidooxidans]|nr:MAG: hypothetical protein C7B44_13455 [Sulfobacillus thermosulfidooxidans]
MIRTSVAKAVEQIPTTEALRARLRRDPVFRWIVGYRRKADIPSAATIPRMLAHSVRISAGKPCRRSKWRPPISTKSCRPSTRPTTPRMVRRPRSGMRKVRPEDRAQGLEISVVQLPVTSFGGSRESLSDGCPVDDGHDA